MEPTARKALYALVALALLSGAGALGSKLLSDSRAEAARLKAVADQIRGESRQWQIIAESRQQIADELARKAARRDTVTLTRYRAFRDTVTIPDTCKTIVAQFDTTIAQLDSSRIDRRDAFANEQQATAALQAQVTGLEHAYDSLSTAYVTLKRPPHLSLLARLKPELGAGGFVGICTSGSPCGGVGLTLSWRF